MPLNKTVIKHEGMEVWCYGEMSEDMNVSVITSNEAFDGVWANDDECSSWPEVVKSLAPWARRNGFTLEELGAC